MKYAPIKQLGTCPPAAAKGIFVNLNLWFFASKGKDVEKDYAELCSQLNVRQYEHLSKIRETLGISLAELVNIG